MKITPRKNDYNHEVVDCPFCDYFAYLRPVTKVSPDPLRDLKRHITNGAKNEALAIFMSDTYDIKELEKVAPHLLYYKQHTTTQKIVQTTKRVYDNDMTI